MDALKVMLAGGPDHLPADGRLREVASLEDKVKVQYGAGYEHFAHSGETIEMDGMTLPVYTWQGRTRIAE